MLQRRAKIVCTLGPASDEPDVIRSLIAAGLDVARLNLSYGTTDSHRLVAERVRAAAAEAGRTVAVLADLQGPKIRVGTLEADRELREGERIVLADAGRHGGNEVVPTTHGLLSADVRVGHRLLLRDGTIRAVAEAVTDGFVTARVEVPGTIRTGSGLNLPDSSVTAPAVTDEDVSDLEAALAYGADLVALSFVRAPEDADAVRAVMERVGRTVPVIAKIEKPQAVDRIDEIVEAFDGIMVARGDLGVEVDLTRVPLIQKAIIDRCRAGAKPVIVATEMLESMIERSRPTRAEASDVVNAVLDGADALMLSAETSMGADPVLAVRTMSDLIVTAEHDGPPLPPRSVPEGQVDEAVVAGAVAIADAVAASAIVVVTSTGSTARRVAAHRPRRRILVIGRRALPEPSLLLWGTEPCPCAVNDDPLPSELRTVLHDQFGIAADDTVVVVTGDRPGVTNLAWALEPGR